MEILKRYFRLFKKSKLGMVGLFIFISFILLAIFSPYIAPYDPIEYQYRSDGSFARMDPPSSKHLLGTSLMGRDVLSQVIIGSRVALFVGIISAILVVFIGINVGLIAGYYGGKIDIILMRITDIVYSIPFLPFCIILVALIGPGILNIIIAITLISWRSVARVIRAQVLSLKERPFIEAAKVSGTSDTAIIYRHIMPNIMPLALNYIALSMSSAILAEASISFLGYGDPRLVSWGKMLFSCYVAQAINIAWWWVIPPGVSITLLVMSGFFIGRAFDDIFNPMLRER